MSQADNQTTATPFENSGGKTSVAWFAFLLLIVFVLFDLSAYAYFRDVNKQRPAWDSPLSVNSRLPSKWMRSFVRGALMGQIAILYLATVGVRTNVVVRLLGSGLCLLGLAHLGAVSESTDAMNWFGGLSLYGVLLLTIVWLATSTYLRIEILKTASSTSQLNSDRRTDVDFHFGQQQNWQFTVWGLLSVITAAAIALAAAKFAEFPIGAMLRNWPIFLILASGALAMIGSVLIPSRSVVVPAIILGLIVLLITASALVGWVGTLGSDDFQLLDVLSNCATAGIAAVVLRVAGLRIAWQRCAFSIV